MHRQSLGSPAYKLHTHGLLFPGAGIIKDDISTNNISEDHRTDKLLPASSSDDVADDEERKSQKSVSVSSSTKLVHLIPLLTFLCFVILYLSSHDPSGTDVAQFSGYSTFSSKKTVTDSVDDIDDNIGRGFMETEKNNVLAIRRMRNLQQQERRRFHRKFGQ
ncbi:uncharacterized protein [Rutidosis leptorrhynchoides]|uniref:uncharacterized protein n=1 Tax=Rutidosis leptorrhynchoides TaxID=125765 RepID=UPI003A9A2B96